MSINNWGAKVNYLAIAGVFVLCYLIGAIPFGWMITWQIKKIDIRYHASGRMGMSNVMRTAGTPWGLLTAILDIAKGFFAVWVVRWLIPEPQPWMAAIGGILAVIGHIYSIFVLEKRRDGRYHFRGGAGGLTSLGAAIALWPPVAFFIVIPCALIYFIIGYASIPTALFMVFASITFAVFAAKGNPNVSWWFVVYSIVSGFFVCMSLRPNFKRLKRGDERKTNLRLRWRKEDRKAEASDKPETSAHSEEKKE